jgi:hypothetical protein
LNWNLIIGTAAPEDRRQAPQKIFLLKLQQIKTVDADWTTARCC